MSAIPAARPPFVAFFSVLITALFLSPCASLAILPLGDEQQSWSDLWFPSATGVFDSGLLTITANVSTAELEIGSQFGPNNPGWHYGADGTRGGTFPASLVISRLFINPDGTLKNNDSIVTVSYGTNSPGGLRTDYGAGLGTNLLNAKVREVLIDAAGADTLDLLFTFTGTGGILQEIPNPDSTIGKFAPGNLGLFRFAIPNLPNNWSSNFNFTATSLHVFGLVPEPGTCSLACLAAFVIGPARSRRRSTLKVAA